MLLINGYTSSLAQKLKLAPIEGKPYWANSVQFPIKILKDCNICYIHPATALLSSAKERFHLGYDFAYRHEKKIKEHLILSGNYLKIVAHSQGVAFAEGISAYFFEERGLKTDVLIALNGEQMASTPQSRNAINCRISLRTKGDLVTNKRNEDLTFTDVSILEDNVNGEFIKYDFFLPTIQEKSVSSLYFKGSYNWRTAHIPHLARPRYVWDAVKHGLQLHTEKQMELMRGENQEMIIKIMKQLFNQN